MPSRARIVARGGSRGRAARAARPGAGRGRPASGDQSTPGRRPPGPRPAARPRRAACRRSRVHEASPATRAASPSLRTLPVLTRSSVSVVGRPLVGAAEGRARGVAPAVRVGQQRVHRARSPGAPRRARSAARSAARTADVPGADDHARRRARPAPTPHERPEAARAAMRAGRRGRGAAGGDRRSWRLQGCYAACAGLPQVRSARSDRHRLADRVHRARCSPCSAGRRGSWSGRSPWPGFAVGAWLGTRLGPLVLHDGRRIAVGAAVRADRRAGRRRGVRARLRGARRAAARAAAQPGGAAVDGHARRRADAAASALGIAWVLGALALANGGDAARTRSSARRSCASSTRSLPPVERAARRAGALRPVPAHRRPGGARAAAARRRSPATPGVRAARGASCKILGTPAGWAIEGSGWVAAPGIVVTNAHVVAGQHDTRVLLARPRGRRSQAQALVASTRATTSRSCASRASGAGAAARRRPARRAPRRRSSASRENGPFDVARRAPRATRAR